MTIHVLIAMCPTILLNYCTTILVIFLFKSFLWMKYPMKALHSAWTKPWFISTICWWSLSVSASHSNLLPCWSLLGQSWCQTLWYLYKWQLDLVKQRPSIVHVALVHLTYCVVMIALFITVIFCKILMNWHKLLG